MTYEQTASQMTRYRITFGSNFNHVSDECKELIVWLLHPCDSWRPDARLVLACPPFAASSVSEDKNAIYSFETQFRMAAGEEMPRELFSHSSAEPMRLASPSGYNGSDARDDAMDSDCWQSRVRYMTTLEQCLFGFTHSV
eukprot:TRINITY_DN18782_c0_g1_i1.p2 TRINITY_DN18782_c0_g1~~TRINITY_DN18782_c0_g1_i1.p2  ORF type:complete len:140 (+),score=25.01 TRINITY_DN18782_c0_g1_i1:398-817(+)